LPGPAVIALQHLAEAAANDEERAANLTGLSVGLSSLGRREEALAAIGEAVTIYRGLAEARPDAFLPDLAMSLSNHSVQLSAVGRPEDALTAIEAAIAIRRELARARPVTFAPRLRSSLILKAELLQSMGRRSNAEIAFAEARQLSLMR
jgi:tetratricopeptide (TPR) repeat protein